MRQAEQLGLGHAILCAERVVGDEPLAVLLLDDFLTQKSASNTSNVTEDLINVFETSGQAQLSVMQVTSADISKYGVLVRGDTLGAVVGIVEKPSGEEAPSDMASIGCYISMPDIFNVLRDLPAGIDGEIQLADVINIQAKRSKVNAVHSTALRFDCGSVNGFLAAISHVSSLRNS